MHKTEQEERQRLRVAADTGYNRGGMDVDHAARMEGDGAGNLTRIHAVFSIT